MAELRIPFSAMARFRVAVHFTAAMLATNSLQIPVSSECVFQEAIGLVWSQFVKVRAHGWVYDHACQWKLGKPQIAIERGEILLSVV